MTRLSPFVSANNAYLSAILDCPRKSRRSSIAVMILIVVAGIFSTSCSQPRETPTVRIGYLNIVASLPLFIAEEKGFLEAEGLKYKTVATATSNQLVDAVLAGNLDCFIESSAVPVLAVELQSPGKLKIVSVSEITSKAPFDALLVKEESPVKALSDLAGKKIGVFPGSTATNLLKKYLADSRIDVSSVVFVPMPPPNHLAALIEGSVDAIHAYEPTTAIAMSKGGIRKLHGSVYAEMLSPNPQGVAVVGSAFVQQHPETAKKLIGAFDKAMAFMKENDAEARQILVKRMKLSEDAVKLCVFLYMLPHDQIPVDILQRYADMLTDLGELSGHVEVKGLVYQQ